ARCALALGRLDDAERESRIIENEKSDWGKPMSCLIRAALAAARGDRAAAADTALTAQQLFAAAGIHHYAAAAQRRRGELLGGDEGLDLVKSADAYLASQHMRNPERIVALLAPGSWGQPQNLVS